MPDPGLPLRFYRGVHRVFAPAGRRLLPHRAGAAARWTTWAESARPAGPLVWVHGASVGELLAAAPIARRLHRLGGAPAVVYSFTSASVASRPALMPCAHRDYLPLDLPEDIGLTLDAVRPECVVLPRGDLWPEFLTQAAERRIPVVIVGGAIRRGSRKLHPPALSLYADTARAVSWVGAVGDEDADRWRRLGVRGDAVEVAGDPRHDEVLERPTSLGALAPYRAWAATGPVLVAGSVEPSDVAPLFAAWNTVYRRSEAARLLVVPHDPSERMIARLRSGAARAGVRTVIGEAQAAAEPTGPRCVVHDRVGDLQDLYALGAAAYVGGGFGRHGLHSVIEPAALAVPVLAGPYAHTDRDADALARVGGLVTVTSAEALAAAWMDWFSNADRRVRAGLRARSGLTAGAADRCTKAVATFLEGQPL